jgi:hypothetical protein
VAAAESRLGRTLKLPDGGLIFIKVATQDLAGAFFLTEQPSGQKRGPPKHFHIEEDDWFYCLAGEYIVEIGAQRYELKPPLAFQQALAQPMEAADLRLRPHIRSVRL